MKHISKEIVKISDSDKPILTDRERHALYTRKANLSVEIGDMVEFRNSSLSRLKIVGRVINITPRDIAVKTVIKFGNCDTFTIKREAAKIYVYKPPNSAKNL